MEKAQANASSKAKWTAMVYMAGDNNLDGAETVKSSVINFLAHSILKTGTVTAYIATYMYQYMPCD